MLAKTVANDITQIIILWFCVQRVQRRYGVCACITLVRCLLLICLTDKLSKKLRRFNQLLHERLQLPLVLLQMKSH
jgi:hypothetical protein